MSFLLARADEVLLQAQYLRMEGRALRREAALRAKELGRTILRTAEAAGKHKDAPDQKKQAPALG
jgi:hypothetical protein